MSTKTIKFGTLAGILLALGASVSAQESRGTINGRVMDPSGAIVTGAEVRAINEQTNVAASAKTNDAGNFSIPFLLPGTYKLTVDLTGFKKTEKPGVVLRVGDVLNVDLTLGVGNASETIEVGGGAPLVESSTVQLGQVVGERQLQDLPIPAGNANELVLLTPGVVNSTNLRQRESSFNSAS